MTKGRAQSKDPSERVLRPRAWLVVLCVIVCLMCVGGTVLTYRASGWGTVSLTLTGLTVFGVAALLDLLLTEVRLTAAGLRTRSLLRRSSLDLDAIDGVKWERGSGVFVQLAAGGWVKLPELGYSSPALAGVLRAWLAQQRRAGGLEPTRR